MESLPLDCETSARHDKAPCRYTEIIPTERRGSVTSTVTTTKIIPAAGEDDARG
jgi:hypothetical protein